MTTATLSMLSMNANRHVHVVPMKQEGHVRHVGLVGVEVAVDVENPGKSVLAEDENGSAEHRGCSWDLAVQTDTAPPVGGGGMMGGMGRTKSLFSLASSLSSASTSDSLETDMGGAAEGPLIGCAITPQDEFGADLRKCTGGDPHPVFNGLVRKTIEPHMRKARLLREGSRDRTSIKVDASIASSVGVPYTALRHERRFLFDEHTHPLHEILAQTLQVDDLSEMHQKIGAAASDHDDSLLMPLLDRERRHAFHVAYDSFVTSFCIPLLHSLAISKKVFHTSSSDRITYRYQAFPSIQIVRPGSKAVPPRCDTSRGHSIGCLNFHIPLTPSFGSNALYVESHPGREDWHALNTKSVGLGYLFDGARCLHFSCENTTDITRVSLDFRVIIHRECPHAFTNGRSGNGDDSGGLCPPEMLEDKFSLSGPGYYDEATIDLNRDSSPGLDIVVKKNGRLLFEPDARVGSPFV